MIGSLRVVPQFRSLEFHIASLLPEFNLPMTDFNNLRIHTAADAIITIDQSGIIDDFNLSTEKMFG